MKLTLNQPFSIEIKTDGKEDEIIIGTLTPLTKKQQKEFEKDFKKNADLAKKLQKATRSLNRNIEKIEKNNSSDYEAKYKLEDEIELLMEQLSTLDTEETTAEKRFELSVESESKDRLIELSDIVGYRQIMTVISKDINEKQGNDIPA